MEEGRQLSKTEGRGFMKLQTWLYFKVW